MIPRIRRRGGDSGADAEAEAREQRNGRGSGRRRRLRRRSSSIPSRRPAWTLSLLLVLTVTVAMTLLLASSSSLLVQAFRSPLFLSTTRSQQRRQRQQQLISKSTTNSPHHSSNGIPIVYHGGRSIAASSSSSSSSSSLAFARATTPSMPHIGEIIDSAAEEFDNNASNKRNSSSSSNSKSRDDGSSSSSNSSSSSSSGNIHKLLKRFIATGDVERAIVRLGRKGRTDDALKLYHAVWALDGLRHQQQKQLKQKQKQNQQQQQQNDDNNNNNGGEQESAAAQEPPPSPQLQQFISSSKLRPTTRLMNAAIDACSRSSPPARQTVAFRLFRSSTSPRNEDGSKKPGGALSPNVFTFGSLLACCARNGDVTRATELLRVLEAGEDFPDVAPNEVIYSTVVSACERAEEPDVELALRVLNRGIATLAERYGGTMGAVGFNAAIGTMARAFEWRMAVRMLGEMILHSKNSTSCPTQALGVGKEGVGGGGGGCSRSNPSFVPLENIREGIMGSDDDDEDDKQNRPAPLLHIGNDGIVIPEPDEVTFGTVLAACERSGEWEELLNVAKAATEYGARLDGMALTSVLHACQQLGLADEALEYLELMKQLGDDGNEEEQHKTNGHRRKGAKQPLRGPDGVAYRLTISACARAPGGHRWQDGIRILDEMGRVAIESNNTADCAPDVVAYTAAIAGCSEAGEYTEAMQLISKMRSEGIQPNVVTFSAVINACASASAKLATRMRREDEMIMDFGSTDATTLEDVKIPMIRALRLLQAIKSPTSSVKPNIVTYNAAIRACAEGLNLDGAFDLLRQAKEDGLKPTIVTYGSLMTACERVGDIEAASKVFRMIKQEEDERLSEAVAAGDNEYGEEQLLQVNEIIYGAAISCCRKARQPERALLLLRKMISEKLSPNTATFNTVIAALSENKFYSKTTKNDLLWEKALAVYKVMKSKHAPPGVSPNRYTYNILVRCLSSNLQPAYAEWMLADMRRAGYVPDVDLYTLTVRSYEKCGNPIKALGLMEAMVEAGYDFYELKVLDKAFKNGVRVLNKVGKGFSGPMEGIDGDDDDEDTAASFGIGGGENGALSAYAMSEVMMDSDDDEDQDDYQLIDSLR